jgi:hypothetical protein
MHQRAGLNLPRQWPVRSAINGASATCLRRGAACGEGVGVEASSGHVGEGLCEHRALVRAARADCGSGGRLGVQRGHAWGKARACARGAARRGPGAGCG